MRGAEEATDYTDCRDYKPNNHKTEATDEPNNRANRKPIHDPQLHAQSADSGRSH